MPSATIHLRCLGLQADGVRLNDDALYNLLLLRTEDFDEALIELRLVLL